MDEFDNYRKALVAGGVSETTATLIASEERHRRRKIQSLVCPECGGLLTRALDPRQSGGTEIAGKWFNYRCASKCGWFTDICEPVGEN